MKSRTNLITVLAVLGSTVHSFSPMVNRVHNKAPSALSMSAETATTEIDVTDTLVMPMSFDEMIKQASAAMSDAYDQGLTRQVVRVLLPRDPTNEQIGTLVEEDADTDTQDLVLVPLDESWQGGIMQMYRAAAPTCREVLRRFSRNTNGIPPRIEEDRSVDESGVDGVGLWVTQNTAPEDDVSCFLQPTQESIDFVETISKQAGKRLVLLMNPQWRFVDDALDSVSRGEGFLGSFASFLGGKGGSLKRLDEMGFDTAYALEGYVCRGGNIRLVKRFDSDWVAFAENDAATGYIKLGTSKSRPTYQDVDQMLVDKGIAFKYARDIGLAPKL